MRDGRPRAALLVLLATLLLAPRHSWTQRPLPDCPGLGNGQCTQRCRETTCRALADFFRLSYNDSNPWEDGMGWISLKTQSCRQLLSPPSPTPPYCGWLGLTCCTGADAATGKCAGTGSLQSLRLEVMQANASIADPEWMAAVTQLHSCGLTEFTIDSANLSGNMTEEWGRLTNLTLLELSNNWLTGTIPTSMARLTRLRHLGLGTNFFSGPIPPGLGRMKQLQVLNLGANAGLTGPLPPDLGNLTDLVELNLETNALTGTLPPGLCHPGSQLRVLNLRNNLLRGSATQVEGCRALTQLDVSNNQLTGPLPASRSWDQLVSYRVMGNRLTGGVPHDLYHVPVLGYLDASSNQLNGTIASTITMLTYLSQLNLSQNRLHGTLPLDVWYLPQLARLDLSNNQFTGGLSSAVQFAYGMVDLDLSDNPRLYGQLPRELAGLQHLESVDVGATAMACSGPLTGQVEHTALAMQQETQRLEGLLAAAAANPSPCPAYQLLPCFLTFADYYVPRDDDSHMACRPIRRKPSEELVAHCGPQVEAGGGGAKETLARQIWTMDPAYYQYRNCRCLDGWVASSAANSTWLSCVPAPPESRAWVTSVVQGGVALGVVLCAALVAWPLMMLYFKPRWLRERELMAKRKKPPPTSGEIAMVVTDIEGYSDLMSSAPQLMMRALVLHNTVIRRVCQHHAGHVVEQEGDSFTCVFHEPGDAVAFCLQSQLQLFKLDWPRNLTRQLSSGTVAATDPSEETKAHAALTDSLLRDNSMDSNGWAGWGTYLRARLTGRQGSANSGSTASPHLPRAHSGNGLAARGASFTSIPSASSGDSGILPRYGEVCSGPGGGSGGSAPVDKEDSAASFTSSANGPLGVGWRSGSMSGRERQAPGDALPTIASITSDGRGSSGSGSKARLSLLGSSLRQNSRTGLRLHGSRVFSMFFNKHEEDTDGEAALFRGLRVRMGVATGYLPPGQDLSSCAIKDLAAEVTNLAHGGQVLMEGTTFAAVHGLLGELGALDARGYNHKLLSAKQRAAFRTMLAMKFRWLCSCIVPMAVEDAAAASRPSQTATDAVALDMGSYLIPGVTRTPSPVPPTSSGWGRGMGGGAGGDGGKRARWAAVFTNTLGGLSGGGSEDDDAADGPLDALPPRQEELGGGGSGGLLQVYSISSPALVGRARLWGSRLAFEKQGTRQVSKAYFDAPGTLMSDLDPSKADSESLPLVTMVFVMVEGAKAYARRKRGEAARVHALLHGALADTLAHFADGYLCREQEGDFKYMVAFLRPASALEWCLLMQEVALHLPWPPAVLGVAGWREERGAGGELLFRGPRLKMGLCEGCPRAIMPDHLGRADYHGNSINAAARFCAAAAQGGQVVLEEALAHKILGEVWLPGSASCASSSAGEEGGRTRTAGHSHSSGSSASEPDAPLGPDACDQQQHGMGRLVAVGSSHALGNGDGEEVEEAEESGAEGVESVELTHLATSPPEVVVLSESSYPPAAGATNARIMAAHATAAGGASRLQRSSSSGADALHQPRGLSGGGGAAGGAALPEPRPAPVLVGPRQVSFSGRTVFSGRPPSFTAPHNASFTTTGGTSSSSTPLGSPLVRWDHSLPPGTSPRSALRRAGSEPGATLGSPSAGGVGLGDVEEGSSSKQRHHQRSSSMGRRKRRCNSDADSVEMTRLVMGGALVGGVGNGAMRAPASKPREAIDVHTPPARRVPMRVAFTRLGTWSFKGTGTTRLVAAATNALIARTFPAEAPGGKGALLEPPEEPLLLEDAEVPLQDLVSPAVVALEAARRREAALLAEVLAGPDPAMGDTRLPAAQAAVAKANLLRRASMPASRHAAASPAPSLGVATWATARALKRSTTVASGARTADLGQAVVQLRQQAGAVVNRRREGGRPGAARAAAPAPTAANAVGSALLPTHRPHPTAAATAAQGAPAVTLPGPKDSTWLEVDEEAGQGGTEAALVRQLSSSGAVGVAFSERAGNCSVLDSGELAALRDQQQQRGGEDEV